ncbi:MAG: hypothetical protein D6753_04465 [Planctomycetota bacterium]|nr:MAG: hypothetical protein D6753_04465 [Planctomycetota bacterium]
MGVSREAYLSAFLIQSGPIPGPERLDWQVLGWRGQWAGLGNEFLAMRKVNGTCDENIAHSFCEEKIGKRRWDEQSQIASIEACKYQFESEGSSSGWERIQAVVVQSYR